jgi:hypothetical protein
MAISAEAKAVNTKVDELMAAFETYIDTLATGAIIQLALCKSKYGDNANNTKYGSDTGQALRFDTGVKLKGPLNPNETGDIPFELAGHNLFWKVTTDANELDST